MAELKQKELLDGRGFQNVIATEAMTEFISEEKQIVISDEDFSMSQAVAEFQEQNELSDGDPQAVSVTEGGTELTSVSTDVKPEEQKSEKEIKKKPQQRGRIWATAISCLIASIPALLTGCSLGFPSVSLFDLRALPPEFELSTVLLDIYAVSEIFTACHWLKLEVIF